MDLFSTRYNIHKRWETKKKSPRSLCHSDCAMREQTQLQARCVRTSSCTAFCLNEWEKSWDSHRPPYPHLCSHNLAGSVTWQPVFASKAEAMCLFCYSCCGSCTCGSNSILRLGEWYVSVLLVHLHISLCADVPTFGSLWGFCETSVRPLWDLTLH